MSESLEDQINRLRLTLLFGLLTIGSYLCCAAIKSNIEIKGMRDNVRISLERGIQTRYETKVNESDVTSDLIVVGPEGAEIFYRIGPNHTISEKVSLDSLAIIEPQIFGFVYNELNADEADTLEEVTSQKPMTHEEVYDFYKELRGE